MVLLPVPLRPTVYQSSMISKSSRGMQQPAHSAGRSTALALDRRQRRQPVAVIDAAREEAAPRPAIAAVDGHEVARGVDDRRRERVRIAPQLFLRLFAGTAPAATCAPSTACAPSPWTGRRRPARWSRRSSPRLPSSEPPKRFGVISPYRPFSSRSATFSAGRRRSCSVSATRSRRRGLRARARSMASS